MTDLPATAAYNEWIRGVGIDGEWMPARLADAMRDELEARVAELTELLKVAYGRWAFGKVVPEFRTYPEWLDELRAAAHPDAEEDQ